MMEFEEQKLLRISGTDENFTDISFVEPVSSKNDTKNDHESVIIDEIRRNIWGCDLVLCLFFAALNSYRQDRCLRPFPSCYISNEEGKDFHALKCTCDSIPSLESLVNETKKCSKDVIKFLHWLLIEKGHTILKRKSFNSVPLCSSEFKLITKPQYVFEVIYQDKVEQSWEKRKKGRDVILAYHGSAIDNFYSILKVGLQQHFSFGKEVLFGNGIYLSNEISISAHYSQFGQTWPRSLLGTKLSIVAICEVINDIEKVKCKDSRNRQRSLNPGGMGEIPDKYFVVTDNDMVRLKYLMIYRKKNSFLNRSFLIKNIFFFVLGLYVLLIALLAMSSNLYFTRIVTRLNPWK